MTTKESFPNAFIIGLTGTIGSGKSTVLKMLQHLSVYGIDADVLGKRALTHPPTLAQIKKRFGEAVLNKSGEIDRKKIAEIVFQDKKALADLEGVTHPYVTRATKKMMRMARLPIIVIEAIKLLESDLADLCDSIWVVETDTETVIKRLAKQRGMPAEEVGKRLANQASATDMKEKASVVINNNDAFEAIWKQVIIAVQALRVGKQTFKSANEWTIQQTGKEFPQILLPFTDKYDEMMKRLINRSTESGYSFTPCGETFSEETFAELTSRYFLLDADAEEGIHFPVWDLSTFRLECKGIFEQQSKPASQNMHLDYNQVESFAEMHRVEVSTVPMKTILKEKEEFLRGKGYIQREPSSEKDTQWLKAGYNLFSKQFWDGKTLFESDES